MNAYMEILAGIVMAIVGVAMLVVPQLSFFREDVITVILGVIPIIVLLVAAIFLMIGVSDIKEGEEEPETGVETGTERKG